MKLPAFEYEIIPFEYPEDCGEANVSNISYDGFVLRIAVTLSETKGRLYVDFSSVHGFRVLDEGDICGFWSASTTSQRPIRNGDVCLVKAGGWFDLESMREDFLMRSDPCKEYLVVGSNTCVSVLTSDVPVFDSHLGLTFTKINELFGLGDQG